MRRINLALAAVSMVVVILASGAYAGGNATADSGYRSTKTIKSGNVSVGTTPGASASSSGQLPFTGMDVAVLIVGGAALGLVGYGMRRAGKHNN